MLNKFVKTPIRIHVPLKERSYEVVVGGDGLKGIGKELINAGFTLGIKILIVTNDDVARHYADVCSESLTKEGFKSSLLVIQSGEKHKNTLGISIIHDAAYINQLERGSVILALGGGIVGDMAGFAASTWLRGISVVQVPTTLLAMVDASIGGKTGVNHPKGKNLIGSFHQPRLVLTDPSTLYTLPDREFRAGIAEVIKYGVICDLDLFNELENMNEIGKLKYYASSDILKILKRSIIAKVKIVTEDEFESGKRATLNYGHTFAHVIETLCGYGNYLHGEAVAIGMVAASELSVKLNIWTRKDADRQKQLIRKAGLPTKWPDISEGDVWEILKGDKKVSDGKIRFVLPTCIGHVELFDNITKEDIFSTLSQLI